MVNKRTCSLSMPMHIRKEREKRKLRFADKNLFRKFNHCLQTNLGVNLQYDLNGSNPDGSFTVDDSNSFLSPYELLPIAQENKYLREFSYFIVELYVVCTHKNRLIEAIVMSTFNIQSLCRKSKRLP